MLRLLPVIAYFAFFIYTLVALIQTPDEDLQHLPKPLWILLVIAIPGVGGICWWLVGRRTMSPPPRPNFPRREPKPRGPLGPDDDPDFLKGL